MDRYIDPLDFKPEEQPLSPSERAMIDLADDSKRIDYPDHTRTTPQGRQWLR